MTQINIDTNNVQQATTTFSTKIALLQTVSAAATRAYSLACPLSYLVAGLDSTLRQSVNNIRDIESDCRKLQQAVNKIASMYEQTEQEVTNLFDGNSGTSGGQSGATQHNGSKSNGSSYASWGAGIAAGGSEAEFAGSLFGYESSDGEWGASISEKGGEIGYNEKIEGWVFKGEASAKYGDFSTNADVELLDAYAKGEAGIKYGADGIGIGAAAGIGISALAGSISTQKGSDQFNQHASASGSIGTASASAEAYIGTDGAKAKLSAEVCAAKGEVKTGFTVFGIDVDFGVEGKAGAAGVEAGAEISSDGLSLDAGASAIVGFGVSVDVDWSDFSIPGYDTIKKWLF